MERLNASNVIERTLAETIENLEKSADRADVEGGAAPAVVSTPAEPNSHQTEAAEDRGLNIVTLPKPFDTPAQNIRGVEARVVPKIWAVGSGKGGVGKSLLSASLSVNFARKGFSVLAIDMDVGGSNLHTCLGVNPPKSGLGDWAVGRAGKLQDVAAETDLPNLRVISGANDSTRITQLMKDKTPDLFSELRAAPVDHVFIDLGAGTVDTTLDCFLMADQGIISILPEPTSVENAYRFIRSVLYRKMLRADVPTGIHEVIEASADTKNVLGIKTPHDLLAVIRRLDEHAASVLENCLNEFHPAIVVNQVRSQVDVDVGRAISGVCRRFFGIEIKYPGYIDYDGAVWKAVRSRRPAILEFPRSVLANRIESLTQALLDDE